ncbi:MAG: serine hydrolase domain-containing protein [Gemmataceae bacterium]
MRTLVLLAFLLVPTPLHAAEFDALLLEAVIERGMKDMGVPGAAVVVVKDDKIVYLKAFGVREKGKPEKATPDTVFAIASCSKAFTSTLIAMLADDGKLKWDDKVRDHLDSFRLTDELADREVTLRDLLSHRTGMPRHDMLWSGLTADSDEVIRRWGKGKPSTSFRSTWEYSNVPFTTAGLIAGHIEKSDWASAIQKRIFTPLEMKSSSATWKAAVTSANHATPHYYAFDKSIAPVKWDEIDHAGGAGCINSTATDMGNWLRFQLAGGKFDGKRLLAERLLKETHSPQMLFKPDGVFALYFPKKATRFSSYGLGWFVHDYRGFDCVSHGGTLTGFRVVHVDPREKARCIRGLQPAAVALHGSGRTQCARSDARVAHRRLGQGRKGGGRPARLQHDSSAQETGKRPQARHEAKPATERLRGVLRRTGVRSGRGAARWGEAPSEMGQVLIPPRALPLRHIHCGARGTRQGGGIVRPLDAGVAVSPRHERRGRKHEVPRPGIPQSEEVRHRGSYQADDGRHREELQRPGSHIPGV